MNLAVLMLPSELFDLFLHSGFVDGVLKYKSKLFSYCIKFLFN